MGLDWEGIRRGDYSDHSGWNGKTSLNRQE